MRLFEHPDFGQAILQAAEHFRERGLRPAIIEKDYYVTEVLRAGHGHHRRHCRLRDVGDHQQQRQQQRE